MCFPNVSRVESKAFKDCSGLTRVILPKCSYIGDDAFSGCTSLKYLSLPGMAITTAMNIRFGTTSSNLKLWGVPDGCLVSCTI